MLFSRSRFVKSRCARLYVAKRRAKPIVSTSGFSASWIRIICRGESNRNCFGSLTRFLIWSISLFFSTRRASHNSRLLILCTFCHAEIL